MREKWMRFMQGRYGTDSLSKFLAAAGLILALLSSFLRRFGVGKIFYFIGALLIICCYFRMFSRNLTKRFAENQAFLNLAQRVVRFFREQRGSRGKNHRIYKCPGCGQRIRVPKGKGRIEIRCPRCGKTFRRRS